MFAQVSTEFAQIYDLYPCLFQKQDEYFKKGQLWKWKNSNVTIPVRDIPALRHLFILQAGHPSPEPGTDAQLPSPSQTR